MITKIPLSPVPNQTVTVLLGNQYCRINVYQKTTGLYLDLFINDVSILTGRICRDRVYLVASAYLGFTGDLIFADTNGDSDPEYSGIGTRYFLFYVQ